MMVASMYVKKNKDDHDVIYLEVDERSHDDDHVHVFKILDKVIAHTSYYETGDHKSLKLHSGDKYLGTLHYYENPSDIYLSLDDKLKLSPDPEVTQYNNIYLSLIDIIAKLYLGDRLDD